METLSDYGVSPTQAPDTYPGRWVTSAALIVDQQVLPLAPVQGRRYPAARVTVPEDIAGALVPYAGRTVPLRLALILLNAARIEDRIPHVAVGSNANPSRLIEKMTNAGASRVIPLTRVEVTGLEIGFLPMAASYAVYPATPLLAAVDAPELSLVVAWLDRQQSEAVVSTEQGGYRCVATPLRAELGATLDNGEALDEAVMYWGNGPALADPEGRPLTLRIGPDGRVAAGAQADVRAAVAATTATASFPVVLPPGTSGWEAARRYKDQGGFPGDEGQVVMALPSQDWLKRDGDSCVVVTPQVRDALGLTGDWVAVGRASDDAGRRREVVARLRVEDLDTPDERAYAWVDQQVRDAIGVETREAVTLRPARHRVSAVAQRIVPRPLYSLARVQFAELVSAERDVALVDDIALRIIGASDGDQIVVEGGLDEGTGKVSTVRLRAVSASPEYQEARRRIAGGDENARFPAAEDALGVFPDLPWVYLDSRTRDLLRLGDTKLAAVRIRASRRYQFAKEIRELLLIVVVAAIGLIALLDDPQWRAIVVVVLTVAAIVVVVHRVRQRVTGSGPPEVRPTRADPGPPRPQSSSDAS